MANLKNTGLFAHILGFCKGRWMAEIWWW